MDKLRILSLLEQLDSYVLDLKKHTPVSFKTYAKSVETRRFTERTLQLSIEVCIDISNLLLKELRLGLPSNEESVFDRLLKAKVISSEVSDILKAMKRFRNVLIHKYAVLDDAIVHARATQNCTDFIQFKKEILAYLRKAGKS